MSRLKAVIASSEQELGTVVLRQLIQGDFPVITSRVAQPEKNMYYMMAQHVPPKKAAVNAVIVGDTTPNFLASSVYRLIQRYGPNINFQTFPTLDDAFQGLGLKYDNTLTPGNIAAVVLDTHASDLYNLSNPSSKQSVSNEVDKRLEKGDYLMLLGPEQQDPMLVSAYRFNLYTPGWIRPRDPEREKVWAYDKWGSVESHR